MHICVACLLSLLSTSTVRAGTTTPAEAGMAKRVLFHGLLNNSSSIVDGEHKVQIRLYRKDGALVHEETLVSEVRQGSYDVLIGSAAPLIVDQKEEYSIGVTIDNGKEFREARTLTMVNLLSEGLLNSTLDATQNRLIAAISPGQISAQMAERDAKDRGMLANPYYGELPMFPRMISPITGLNIEMGISAPSIPTTNAYEMAKYGTVNIEYNNFAKFDGNLFGIAGQAMHVAHHLLLYAAGFTTDVNGDGMFLFTLGAARYQVGNSRDEPFVNAPFVRFKYQTSNARIFGYTEFETTVHYRSYLSGTVGVGLRLSNQVKLICGLHHTEFVMPTEHLVREVDGFHGIVSWGF
jgi:hypothetical protein